MDDRVPNLRGGTLTWIAFILGPLLGAIMAGGGILWTMAKQPDRSEFNELRGIVYKMQLDVAVMADRNVMEQKLDEIAKAQKQAVRGR